METYQPFEQAKRVEHSVQFQHVRYDWLELVKHPFQACNQDRFQGGFTARPHVWNNANPVVAGRHEGQLNECEQGMLKQGDEAAAESP